VIPDESFSDSEEEDENEAGTPPDFDPVIEIGADVDETLPLLGGEAKEQIRRSILLHGMDALGWHVSLHVVRVQWGIYIPVTGIAYLMEDVLSKLTATRLTKAHLAFHAILNHELFHFETDYTVVQAEIDSPRTLVGVGQGSVQREGPRIIVSSRSNWQTPTCSKRSDEAGAQGPGQTAGAARIYENAAGGLPRWLAYTIAGLG
jgi:hypothetical protein